MVIMPVSIRETLVRMLLEHVSEMKEKFVASKAKTIYLHLSLYICNAFFSFENFVSVVVTPFLGIEAMIHTNVSNEKCLWVDRIR